MSFSRAVWMNLSSSAGGKALPFAAGEVGQSLVGLRHFAARTPIKTPPIQRVTKGLHDSLQDAAGDGSAKRNGFEQTGDARGNGGRRVFTPRNRDQVFAELGQTSSRRR